jgi:predicted phage tail protein
MPDEPDPPRKVYGFKERDFKRENTPATGGEAMPTAKDLAKLAGHHHNPGQRTGRAKADDPNDVYKVLEQNRQAADEHGLNEVEIKKVKSRRKRDFWLILVGGNLAIIGGVYFSGISVITLVFGLAGLVIFSLGLSWIMWQVMDKY